MKKISILLVVILVLSALLPGLVYAKSKPATPPGQIRLHAVGEKPSTPPGLAKEGTGSVVGSLKRKGWKTFVLEGTVEGSPTGEVFTLKIRSGTVKRVTGKRLKEVRRLGLTVEIKVLSLTTEKGKTIYWSKEKKFKAEFADLKDGARVHVKGDITEHTPKLEARRVIIKTKPVKPQSGENE